MQLTGLQPFQISAPAQQAASVKPASATEISKSFGDMLTQAMEGIQSQQNQVSALNTKFVVGELADVHQLTIAAEKASVGLQLAVSLRNKAVEAYQEIMRTQI
ncbi:flagellar hook-basal body complex protein FliE [Paenibacillus turpanensis]|uniref:flagellar hook-basal body complex protein FliE n=1 Tax=Paenibacillus turpanensis TaxID=2689078 RepID=UPI00140D4342|nr:flagellar hook-basal body complex protein FliE [Paenibacillus turpanensis]